MLLPTHPVIMSKSPVQDHRDGFGNDVFQPDYEADNGSCICSDGQSIALASSLRNDLTWMRSKEL